MNENLVEIPKTNKSVIIDIGIHDRFKLYCKKNNLKIGNELEDLIELYLSNTKIIKDMIVENKNK